MAESSINGHFTEKTIEPFWVQVANHVRSVKLCAAVGSSLWLTWSHSQFRELDHGFLYCIDFL